MRLNKTSILFSRSWIGEGMIRDVIVNVIGGRLKVSDVQTKSKRVINECKYIAEKKKKHIFTKENNNDQQYNAKF